MEGWEGGGKGRRGWGKEVVVDGGGGVGGRGKREAGEEGWV